MGVGLRFELILPFSQILDLRFHFSLLTQAIIESFFTTKYDSTMSLLIKTKQNQKQNES